MEQSRRFGFLAAFPLKQKRFTTGVETILTEDNILNTEPLEPGAYEPQNQNRFPAHLLPLVGKR